MNEEGKIKNYFFGMVNLHFITKRIGPPPMANYLIVYPTLVVFTIQVCFLKSYVWRIVIILLNYVMKIL